MRRVITLVALLLLLPVPAGADPDRDKPPVASAVLGDGLVIPGQRVGPVMLGMSTAQILQIMPSGYTREEFPDQKIVLYEWRPEGFWVSTEADGKTIRIISVFGSTTYHTDKGVQLLHPESRMIALYGEGFRRYEYPEDGVTLIRYVSLGLQFGLVHQPSNPVLHGRIFQIGVFAPGKEPPLAKAPGK